MTISEDGKMTDGYEDEEGMARKAAYNIGFAMDMLTAVNRNFFGYCIHLGCNEKQANQICELLDQQLNNLQTSLSMIIDELPWIIKLREERK